jgi:hypothetical protein
MVATVAHLHTFTVLEEISVLVVENLLDEPDK